MCAIAGILGLGAPLDEGEAHLARAMAAAMSHRGPDGDGFFFDARVALAHRRLSLLDLSPRGAQPMLACGRASAIVYNGETTNHRELAAHHRLEGLRTRTDTEVLARLYDRLGADFVRELNGMFAIGVYDAAASTALLARDPFGQRPLFYMLKPGRLYFASEIKAFLSLPSFGGALDLRALHDFFSLAYVPGQSTPFSEIRELDGGCLLEADLRSGRVGARRYHRIRYEPDPAMTEEDAAALTRQALSAAAARHARADAPVGYTLSGGVDTSALVALAREREPRADLHTFSIRMDEPSFDETAHQRRMVEFARTTHHEVVVTPREVLDNLERHVAFMDEPSGDGAALPTFLMSRRARPLVKALVSGEGGDEVFNAYETHRAHRAREFYRRWTTPGLRRALTRAAAALPSSYAKLSPDFLLKRFTSGAEHDAARAHFHWRRVLDESEKRALLPGLGAQPDTAELFEDAYRSLDFPDPLDRLSWIDLRLYLIGDLMVKNDRMLMAHSVEGRYPMLDMELFEVCRRVPGALRVRGLDGRRVQKRALRGIVPDAVLRRKNMGLEMPHSRWFLGPLRPAAERYFARKSVEKTGLLDHAALDALWRQHLSGRRDNGRALWCALIFLIWLDLFVYERSWRRYAGSA